MGCDSEESPQIMCFTRMSSMDASLSSWVEVSKAMIRFSCYHESGRDLTSINLVRGSISSDKSDETSGRFEGNHSKSVSSRAWGNQFSGWSLLDSGGVVTVLSHCGSDQHGSIVAQYNHPRCLLSLLSLPIIKHFRHVFKKCQGADGFSANRFGV